MGLRMDYGGQAIGQGFFACMHALHGYHYGLFFCLLSSRLVFALASLSWDLCDGLLVGLTTYLI